MPPVVQIPANNKVPQERPKKPGTERRPELFCRVKYCNTLPDIPFDPKFVSYPFDTHRFVQYKQTSLEKNYKHDLLTEADLGVDIDLINPETYDIIDHQNLRLAEEDEKLLEDEIQAPQDTKRSRCHNRAITWLKKTEYISTEFNRYGASSDKTETKVGFGVKKRMRDEDLYLDRESQILAINKTFESAKKPITSHPGKPGVKPVSVVPIFPDFKLWKYPYAQVMFDADPAPAEKEKEMSQAMIRGIMDPESGEQYVAYFLPTVDTMNKRIIDDLEGRDYIEDEEYVYNISREYSWNVKNKTFKDYQENYFFVMRDDVVCYNELETRVKLSKRRVKSSQSNSILYVKHREENEAEFTVQDLRLLLLEPPKDDDEEPANNIENAKSANIARNEAGNDIDEKDNSDAQSEKSDENDSDSGLDNRPVKRQKVGDDSESEKSSSSSSESSSSDSEDEKNSSSSNSSDESDDDKKRRRQETQDIFGSDSD